MCSIQFRLIQFYWFFFIQFFELLYERLYLEVVFSLQPAKGFTVVWCKSTTVPKKKQLTMNVFIAYGIWYTEVLVRILIKIMCHSLKTKSAAFYLNIHISKIFKKHQPQEEEIFYRLTPVTKDLFDKNSDEKKINLQR